MSYYDLFIAERLDTKRWQESVNEICGWSEERTGRRGRAPFGNIATKEIA